MPTPAERAADLLSACEILAAHRGADPSAYRAVHASGVAAVDDVHRLILDPRGGDLEALLASYRDLAVRVRALPVPSTGGAPRRSGADALGGLLGKAMGGSGGLGGFDRGSGGGAGERDGGSRRGGSGWGGASWAGGNPIDALLSEVATGISPNVERAVRDGLRDLFGRGGAPDVDVDVETDTGSNAEGADEPAVPEDEPPISQG